MSDVVREMLCVGCCVSDVVCRFTKCCACHEICTSSAGARPTPGRTSDPLASSKRRTQHANATGRAPVPSRRQGVHPTPWQAASAAHSTQMPPAERRCPADARAYIRPLGKQQAPHTARKGYTGRAPVPSRRQGVHPTPWQAATKSPVRSFQLHLDVRLGL